MTNSRKFQQMIEANINFRYQGDPIVCSATIVAQSETLVAIEVDMKTKYCVVGGSGGRVPNIIICCSEEGKNEPTSIEFPDYDRWNVFALYSGRYTINVCLIKYPSRNNQQNEPDNAIVRNTSKTPH